MLAVGLTGRKTGLEPMKQKIWMVLLIMWANTSVLATSLQRYRNEEIEVWHERIWSPETQPLPVVDKEVISGSKNGDRLQTITDTITEAVSAPTSNLEEDKPPSFLRVERALVNITKDSGESVKMRCEVRGYPQPYIRWYKNEAPLQEERNRIDVRYYSSGNGRVWSRLKINHLDIHDTGYYKCEANNGRHLVDTTGILMVKAGRILPPVTIPNFSPGFPHFPALGGRFHSSPRLPDDEENHRGLCQIYRGITCSQLIRNRTVYVKSVLHQSHMEEKLAAAITVIATSHEISTDCHKYVIPLLCYFAFPLCEENSPHPVARKVCRHECELLQSGSCGLRGGDVQRHPLVSKHNVLPVCEELPPLGSKESANCIRLGLPNAIEVKSEHTCYTGSGIDYRGTVTHTTTGMNCQQWNSKLIEVMEYPELIGGHSYCRNPGGLEVQPWCFTDNPHHPKEFCSIPKCVDYLWLYILVPVTTFITLAGLLVGLWCVRQRKQPSTPPAKSTPTKPQPLSHHSSQQQQQMEMNSLMRTQLRAPEIPLTSIRFLRMLGEGTYGKSYQGEVLGTTSTPVFIKSLREKASPKLQQEFQKEAESLTDFHHPNLACLIGVCSREEPLCLLFEYCFRVDLREYLIRQSPRSEMIGDESRNNDSLDLSDMLHVCKQIASGMDYLASHHYVHKDLAARNCLVGDNLSIKICDFGMWRDLYTSDYYPVLSERPMPVRWMPAESIVYNKFTTESDVWSYGVVLWEIFSYGVQPYFCYSNQEAVDMICSHQLLSCPEDCPPQIYGLMVECWHEIPSHRPTFKELHARLNCWPAVYIRTPSLCHSISTHNGSSTGPSNNTGSTNLSCTTATICTSPFSVRMSSVSPSMYGHQSSINGQWKGVQI